MTSTFERMIESRIASPAVGATTSTLAAMTYDRIRDDIVFGMLKPGQRLKLDALKARYDVGMTPLREALYRLSASMLVLIEDRKGVSVAPISPEHFSEIVAIRSEVETILLHHVSYADGLQWEGNVVAAFHRLQRSSEYKPNPGPYTREWELAHRNFHFALMEPSRIPMLLEFARTLWDHFARYLNLAYLGKTNYQEVFHGHKELMDAVLERDVEFACMLLRRHIALASQPILAALFPEHASADTDNAV